MEKVLRKVSARDRLPEINTHYFVILSHGLDIAIREYSKEYAHWWMEYVEYWYEEISLEELFDKSMLWMKAFELGRDDVLDDNELHTQMCAMDAKKRYKKAIDYVIPGYDANVLLEALKIAAGINETDE